MRRRIDIVFVLGGVGILWIGLLAYFVALAAVSDVNPTRLRLFQSAMVRHVKGFRYVIPGEHESGGQVRQFHELQAFQGRSRGVVSRVRVVGGEICFQLDANAIFLPATSLLAPSMSGFFEELASALGVSSSNIVIEGHTDDIPIQGSQIYLSNWELSAMRAAAVGRMLSNAGLKGRVVSVTGYADHRPLDTHKTVESRRLNRRVEIRLLSVSDK